MVGRDEERADLVFWQLLGGGLRWSLGKTFLAVGKRWRRWLRTWPAVEGKLAVRTINVAARGQGSWSVTAVMPHTAAFNLMRTACRAFGDGGGGLIGVRWSRYAGAHFERRSMALTLPRSLRHSREMMARSAQIRVLFYLCDSGGRRCWSSKFGVLLEIVFDLSVDQGIIYGVSDEVDMAYSSKSGNGLEFV
ncbi:hypothetical protein Tco_0268687 [Tanacetum coccineum]